MLRTAPLPATHRALRGRGLLPVLATLATVIDGLANYDSFLLGEHVKHCFFVVSIPLSTRVLPENGNQSSGSPNLQIPNKTKH